MKDVKRLNYSITFSFSLARFFFLFKLLILQLCQSDKFFSLSSQFFQGQSDYGFFLDLRAMNFFFFFSLQEKFLYLGIIEICNPNHVAILKGSFSRAYAITLSATDALVIILVMWIARESAEKLAIDQTRKVFRVRCCR